MNKGVFEQIGTPNEIYYNPRTTYVANFVGSANIYKKDNKIYAIRSEYVKMNYGNLKDCLRKSLLEDYQKVKYRLEDGQTITSSHSGMDVM